jgi:type II secretory ATPase GspE/PulE/Tfp pilus assembly ATPase PilB-like protein
MNKIIEENDSLGNTSNSDNQNDNGKRPKSEKKTRNRLTKKQQFVNERHELINELNIALGLNNKKTVTLYYIENSVELKNKIDEIDHKIRKYFKSGTWNYYIQKSNNEPSPLIGLIRAIYRDEGWTMTTKDIYINIDDKKIRTTNYYFIKES